MAEQRYTATVTREDGFWVAVVDGVPGGATESRRLSGLHIEVVDLLGGLLDAAEDDLTVDHDYSPVLGEAARPLAHHQSTQRELAQVRLVYERAQRDAVCNLRGADVA